MSSDVVSEQPVDFLNKSESLPSKDTSFEQNLESSDTNEDDEPLSSVKQSQVSVEQEPQRKSPSETEPDNEVQEQAKLKRKRSSSSTSSNSAQSSEEEENQTKKQRKENIDKSRNSSKESSKIIRLKRYLSIAGIRIHNYASFFEGCKSKKSKEMKLLKLFEDEGLKGKPTIEKCKRLRKKLETKKEISELDLGNIINISEDPIIQRFSRTTRNRLKSAEKLEYQQKNVTLKQTNIFGNLSGIIDAESSDENGNEQTELPKKKKRRVVDSEEESE